MFSEIFGKDRFYLEVMEHGIPDQRRVNQGLLRIREKTGLRLAATNDAHYLQKDDHHAHDVLLCIGSGKKLAEPERLRFDTNHFYLKSAEEMAALFPDHPEALQSTVQIAEMCDFTLKGVNSLPAFDVPPGFTIESYFEKVTRDGLLDRRRALDPLAAAGRLRQPIAEYEARLEKEIGVIRRCGFAGYFLIVWDFIRYAKERRIPVGPGRGSAAGSLVAYALRITDIDPLEYDLIFERFLNQERISPPDVDIDFCEARRGEVIEYVTRKYGRENVAQIITFGTMKAKAVVRDVGRVMDLGFAEVDKIAKMIPPDLKMTLDKALEDSPPLKDSYQKDARVKELIDVSRRLEGTTRHASIHAAGVVIAPQPLTDLVPLYKAPERRHHHAVRHEGHRAHRPAQDGLPRAAHADADRQLREDDRGAARRASSIPAPSPSTTRGPTSSSPPARPAACSSSSRTACATSCKRFKPDRLEHLTALNALYRPGPMQMIDDFIKRRHGQTRVVYEHPALEPILKETYGVMVYQEQVMQIASALAGFSLGRGRPAAQGDGQEEGRGDGRPDGEVPEGLRRAQRQREEGQEDLGRDGAVRRVRLQQVALGGLRLARLPDGLSQGELPGLLHGGAADVGTREHRQDGAVHRRVPRDGHPRAAAGRELLGDVLHRRAACSGRPPAARRCATPARCRRRRIGNRRRRGLARRSAFGHRSQRATVSGIHSRGAAGSPGWRGSSG